MSSIIESLDRLQKEEKQSGIKPEASQDHSANESLFSKFGILLWLGASISATVFSYHLGVNQGMQAVKSESPKEWLRYFSDFSPVQGAVQKAQHALPKKPLPALPASVEKAPAAVTPPAQEKKQKFTIQVITYVSETLANEEASRLTQKGHHAFVIPSGKYYQVCLDFFEDKKGAVQKLNGLRKMESYKTAYPGAYVRFLKQ